MLKSETLMFDVCWASEFSCDCWMPVSRRFVCRFGSLQSVRVLPDKYCAFVNFMSKECAGRAMQGLQVWTTVAVCTRSIPQVSLAITCRCVMAI